MTIDANIEVSIATPYFNTDVLSNDMAIFTSSNSQHIVFGTTSNALSIMNLFTSNVKINTPLCIGAVQPYFPLGAQLELSDGGSNNQFILYNNSNNKTGLYMNTQHDIARIAGYDWTHAQSVNMTLQDSGSNLGIGLGMSNPIGLVHLRNGTNSNNIIIEAGRTSDSLNEGLSAINFNGYTLAGTSNVISTDKNRWRVYTDQRSTADYFGIDSYNAITKTSNIYFTLSNSNLGLNKANPVSRLHILGSTQVGTGDNTNTSNAPLTLEDNSGNMLRVLHLNMHSTDSTAYNYQSGKNIYWGELTDAGMYNFRGRYVLVSSNLYVDSNVTFSNTLSNLGDAYFGSNVLINSNLYINKHQVTSNTLSNLGDAYFGSNVLINSNLYVSQNQVTSNTLSNLGNAYFASNLITMSNTGLGTITPQGRLDVRGTAYIGSNIGTQVAIQDKEIKWQGTGTVHYSVFNSNGLLSFNNTSTNALPGVYGTYMMGLNSLGYLGINTATPLTTLHMASLNTSAQIIDASNSSTGTAIGIYQNYAGSTNSNMMLGISGGNGQWSLDSIKGDAIIRTNYNRLLFNTNSGTGNSIMCMLSNGFVGIGTTSPSAKLNIEGGTYSAGTYPSLGHVCITASNSGGMGGSLVLRNPASAATNNASSIAFELDGSTAFFTDSTNAANGLISCVLEEPTSGYASLLFNTFNGGAGATEKMRITSSGYIGIGTTTPNAPLQLANVEVNRKIVLWDSLNNDHQFYGFGLNASSIRYQVPRVDTQHIFYAGNSTTASTELMRITGGGTVGIGTSSPNASYKLDVNGGILTNNNNIYAGSGTITAGTVVPVTNVSYNLGATNSFWNNSYIVNGIFYTGVTIGNTTTANAPSQGLSVVGSVGIGTTSPGAKLHVAGDVLANSIYPITTNAYSLGSDTNRFNAAYITTGYIYSQLSIGTGTPPSYTLDVNGPGLFRNGQNNNQLLFGWTANNYIHSIKTRHNAGANDSTNAIDFYVWQTTDGLNTIGTKQIMSVTSAGVGIGTASPQYKLDVNNPDNIGNTVGNVNTMARLKNSVGNTSELLIYERRHTATNDWFGTSTRIHKRIDELAYKGYIEFGYGDLAAIVFGWGGLAGTELMRIASSGNVGIGKSAPTSKLDVIASSYGGTPDSGGIYCYNSTAGQSNSIAVRTNGSGSPFYSMDIVGVNGWSMGIDNADGNKLKFKNSWTFTGTDIMTFSGTSVGIGTASPNASYKLDVAGSGRFTDTVNTASITTTKNNGVNALFGATNGNAIAMSGTSGNANLVLGFNQWWNSAGWTTGNYTSCYSSGFVYNTTSGTLTYQGTTAAHQNAFNPAMNNNILTVLNSGNVGIGTASPGYKLDVQGNGRFTGNLLINNCQIYYPTIYTAFGNSDYQNGWCGWAADNRLYFMTATNDTGGIYNKSQEKWIIHCDGTNVTSGYNFSGYLNGNISGSSTSCLGNAATATTAESCSGNAATASSAVKLNGANAYTNGIDGWFRSIGQAGWYSQDYAVGIYATETGWIRAYNGAGIKISSNNGVLFDSWGGGWFMSDTTWIRAHGNKNIYTEGDISVSSVILPSPTGCYISPYIYVSGVKQSYGYGNAASYTANNLNIQSWHGIGFPTYNGTNQIFFDCRSGNICTNGKIGIGTDSPGYKLDVSGDINFTGELRKNGSVYGGGSSTVSGDISVTNVIVSQKIGIGTASPEAPLHITASGNNATANGIYCNNPTNSAGQDAVMSLRVGGSLAGNPYIGFDIANHVGWSLGVDNGDSDKFKICTQWGFPVSPVMTIDRNGNVFVQDMFATSDIRKKKDFEPIINSLEIVNKLKGTYFKMINDNDDKRKIGLIAQEVLEVLPEVVIEDSEGFLSISYAPLVALLIETTKEQMQEINVLKEQMKEIMEKLNK